MAEKKVSLATRKNIRDNEEKKKENLGKIEGVTGKTGLEFAWKDEVAVAEALAKNGYADRIGEIFFDSYLSQLADALGTFCQNDDNKAALNAIWKTKKILFEIDEKAEGYQQITFPNGDLRMAAKAGNIWTNIGELGGDLASRMQATYGGTALALTGSKNLKEYEGKRDEYLQTIGAAVGRTGLEFVFKDLKALDAQMKKNGYEDRLGEVFYGSYLQQLAEFVTKLCENDQAKEAFARKWTTKRILFETDAKAQGYQEITFPNGDLRIACKPDSIWTNIGQLGDNVVDQLTSTILGTSLSLKSAQNIREYDEKAQGYLAQIGTAIGRTGPINFTVEDIKGVDAALNKNGYNNRLGEVIWGSYLEQISSKLTSLCADDMVKEAIAGAFTKNLVFKLDPKAAGYQNCKFDAGNLVMFCKPDSVWTNISTLGEDIEKQL